MFMHGRLCYLGLSLERSKLCVQSSQFTYLRGRPQLRSRGFRFATKGFFIQNKLYPIMLSRPHTYTMIRLVLFEISANMQTCF